MSDRPHARLRSDPLLLIACILVVPAAFAAVVAYVTLEFAVCGDAADCERESLGQWQVVVSLVGLVPLGAAIWVLRLGRRRQGLLLLGVAVLTYAVWGVLNDAAVHGWDNLVLLP